MTSANKYWRHLVQTRTRFETVLLVFLVLIVALEVLTLIEVGARTPLGDVRLMLLLSHAAIGVAASLCLLRGRAIGLILGALFFMCSIVAFVSPPEYYGIRTNPSLSFSVDFAGDSHISFNLLAIALLVMFMAAYSKRPPADERDPAR